MKINNRKKRHLRVRKKVKGTSEKPRMVIFRSNKVIYAQIIDDNESKTLVSSSSASVKISQKDDNQTQKISQAAITGEALAAIAIKKKITNIIFDRGGYKFHGRVKALADGARKGGLKF